jgi:hypothetical protein
MKWENLSILVGYLDNQKSVIQRLMAEVAVTHPDSREKVSHLGYMLHNLYGALEDLFQEVARTFENRLEDPSRYHRELLKRMALEIPGIRPALLSPGAHALLNELRGFRHVFRHAYDYELTGEKLEALREKMAAQWELVDQDLLNFRDFLGKALTSLSQEK